MKNAHLVVPKEPVDAEFDLVTEYLPPKACIALIGVIIAVCIFLGIALVNHYTSQIDSLQGRLFHAENLVEELEKENHYLETNNESLSKENATLKCEAYFYGN